MKHSHNCPKCSSTSVARMDLKSTVCIDFGTFHLGDIVVPAIYVCTDCGFSECWIDSEKDLEDIKKYLASRPITTDEIQSASGPPVKRN